MLTRLFAIFIRVAIPGAMAGGMFVYLLSDRPKSESKPAMNQPVELGRVQWQRDFASAVAQAKREDKPLMVLFDEVPGCDTCTGFGSGPLSHPIVVDAATEFVAVAVYNNVPGKDAEILQRFSEPTWNNPVVRFLDADEKDIIPRKDGVYTLPELLSRITTALKKVGKPIPEYLKLANFEANPTAREKAVFAMHCYWEGERMLSALDGVLATRIGMLQGAEVVEVEFDPTVIAYRKLLDQAVAMECAQQVFTRNERQQDVARQVVGNRAVPTNAAINADTQQQYHLSLQPAYYLLPLTQLQATKVNADFAANKSPEQFLSPTQLKMQQQLKAIAAREPERFKGLKPDRSPNGIAKYAGQLEEAIRK